MERKNYILVVCKKAETDGKRVVMKIVEGPSEAGLTKQKKDKAVEVVHQRARELCGEFPKSTHDILPVRGKGIPAFSATFTEFKGWKDLPDETIPNV